MSSAPFHQQLIKVYRQALANGHTFADVEELIATQIDRLRDALAEETNLETERQQRITRQVPAVVRYGAFVLPLVFVGVGLYLVGSAVIPILSYANSSSELTESSLVSPVVTTEVLETTPLAVPEVAGVSTESASGIQVLETEFDYTNLANWFGDASVPELIPDAKQGEGRAVLSEYVLDIPKLDIANAVVAVGGTDLDKSLIAYQGTALPGELGAPVIFGHSVLRQFYNPSEKNPRRYNSIFSTIMTLKPGDEIFVTAAGVRYRYIVQDKTEVKPEDVHILNQSYDERRLKLVTCTPEGTYLRRGVITAQLVSER